MPTGIGILVRVVDASAIATLLFDEAQAPEVAALILGQQLVAPSLFGFELANVCLMKCRRQPSQRDALMLGYSLRHRLAIQEYPVEHAEVFALAEATGLTHYDSSYLWLARKLSAPLLTLDRALARAANGPGTAGA